MWIEDRWGAQHWDVWSVEISRIEHRVALEAHEQFAVGEQRVLVQLDLALNRTGRGDSDVDSVLGESIAATEVVQLLELARDIGRSDDPVRWTAKGCAVDHVRNFQHLVEQGDVAVCKVD